MLRTIKWPGAEMVFREERLIAARKGQGDRVTLYFDGMGPQEIHDHRAFQWAREAMTEGWDIPALVIDQTKEER